MAFHCNWSLLFFSCLIHVGGVFCGQKRDVFDACNFLDCRSSNLEPVCGSNGEIYLNDCHRMKKDCDTDDEITLVDWESCSFKGCPMDCDGDTYRPVCGADNKLYDNMCTFLNASCQRSSPLQAQPLTICVEKQCGRKCSNTDKNCQEEENKCWMDTSSARKNTT